MAHVSKLLKQLMYHAAFTKRREHYLLRQEYGRELNYSLYDFGEAWTTAFSCNPKLAKNWAASKREWSGFRAEYFV